MQLSIGGFRFTFVTNNVALGEIGAQHWISPKYSLLSDSYEVTDEIEVCITDRDAPNISKYTKIFESEFSWKCYKDSTSYLIVEPHPQSGSNFLVTRIEAHKKSVTIFCSKYYLEILSQANVTHPFSYPLDQIVMSFLIKEKMGAIVHSAGWLHHGNAWVLPGRSGAGKSTISRLIKQVTGDEMLSDDRIILRKSGENVLAFGTPWAGDEKDAKNVSVPLKGLLFIVQGKGNSITQLSPMEGFKEIMKVMTVPWYDEDGINGMMDFCNFLLENVPVYRFSFTRDADAVQKLLDFVDGN